LTSDGKNVIMPVEIFKLREGDLRKYEELIPLLKAQLEEERNLVASLRERVFNLEGALSRERKATERLIVSLKGDRQKYGILGFVVGGMVVGLVK